MPTVPTVPPPYDTDRAVLETVCEVEYVRASGPGGQHRNRRETGVRLHHPPSGVVIFSTERRSRTQNLSNAFARLAERLEVLNEVPAERRSSRVPNAERKRRRADKRQQAEKKALRRPPPEAN